jgi:hypothetical protein
MENRAVSLVDTSGFWTLWANSLQEFLDGRIFKVTVTEVNKLVGGEL